MVVSYMSEKKFRDFIRSVVALAFLPLNQIEAAIDELKAVEFEKDSPAYEQMTKLREKHLEYIESTWLYGSFQPKLWNHWKKSRNLTNNHNEGYNSRINKILSVFHPNPFVLVCMLVKELGRAEVEALWIKAGNPKKTKMSTLYEKLVFRRESLMEQFERGELPRLFYLQQMGAISLKSDKAASRMVLNIEDDKIESNTSTSAAADVPVDAPVDAESDSEDSLSETRPAVVDPEESFSDPDDPFVSDPVVQAGDPLASDPVLQGQRRKKNPEAAKKNERKQLCPVCKRGFQLRRLPALHVACDGCQMFIHKRCTKDSVNFVCDKCKPASPEIHTGCKDI